jgi:thymidylate synthase
VSSPTFEALYYSDRIHVVNPTGDVGIVSLWTPYPATSRKLGDIVPDMLDAERGRIAVVSNLYGDGMCAMFCNLLFNPQIRYLVAVGEDLGLPTVREIEAFLRDGLEDGEMFGRTLKRIRGTDRFFPDVPGFDEDRLRKTLSFRYFGRLSDPSMRHELPGYLRSLPHIDATDLPERLRVEMPAFDVEKATYLPSNIATHQVERRGPLDCWEELVVRTMRFGIPVELGNGPRLELLNARAVITDPAPESEEVLARYGFSLDRFRAYQKKIMDPALPEGISYTYGNRLGGYFGDGPPFQDALALVVREFQRDPETRFGYISLWDTASDLPGFGSVGHPSAPCLVTLFFRKSEGRLTLTATYRAHNLLTAWLENVYGLMAIQQRVAEELALPIGPITVVSHSLGADPYSPRFELGRSIAEQWTQDEDVDRSTGRHSLREDPNGYFTVSVDDVEDCLVVEHRIEGLLLARYTSDRASILSREIIGDMAVSLVSHAMWLGRELAIKEQQLHDRRRRRSADGSPSRR